MDVGIQSNAAGCTQFNLFCCLPSFAINKYMLPERIQRFFKLVCFMVFKPSSLKTPGSVNHDQMLHRRRTFKHCDYGVFVTGKNCMASYTLA
jgi:hypothetical protein